MFRYQSSKQACIMAVLVILLCLSCITGATLALFTSDAKDGTIGIVTTSGDIGVDIVDTADTSLKGEHLSFLTAAGQSALFEPGATFRTQGFKIKNTGDIPIHFRLSVGKDNVVDVDNKKVDIREFDAAFEVWIVEELPGTTPEFFPTTRLSEFRGSLGVGLSSESTYYLVVKMKESAENEFQGKGYRGIGVTVSAVQGNVPIENA